MVYPAAANEPAAAISQRSMFLPASSPVLAAFVVFGAAVGFAPLTDTVATLVPEGVTVAFGSFGSGVPVVPSVLTVTVLVVEDSPSEESEESDDVEPPVLTDTVLEELPDELPDELDELPDELLDELFFEEDFFDEEDFLVVFPVSTAPASTPVSEPCGAFVGATSASSTPCSCLFPLLVPSELSVLLPDPSITSLTSAIYLVRSKSSYTISGFVTNLAVAASGSSPR